MKSLCIDLFKNCSATSLAGTRSSRVLTYRFQRTNYQTHLPSTKLTFSSYSTKTCFATLSTVTSEVEEKQTFNPDKAGELVKELRNSFNSGRTKSYEWRMSQLENIAKMLEEKEKEITEALYKDLSKPEVEAFISEIVTAKSSCNEALKELRQWMIPQKNSVEKSPAVVHSDVDLQVAVRRTIAGKWALNNGQACIGVDYIITTKTLLQSWYDAPP
ncbi:unnamed protein product [Prunus armeniaca]|uniref:Aldehyde dehydrogenase domain-containing protein n=1 Tax=Prunus armeniaca TaxID=36596 RepID=A0A6J5URH7_PRUAR|nr:unnamed protein product [Prunus armeniaca]